MCPIPWITHGEDGAIEWIHREKDGELGSFPARKEKTILTFARGEKGKYMFIEDPLGLGFGVQ